MVKTLESLYLKLPTFSENSKRIIIESLPFLCLIFGILLILVSILDLFGTPFISVLTSGGGSIIKTMLINILGIIQGILMIMAFRGLRGRQMRGWRLFYWSQILWIIAAVISLSPAFIIALVIFYPLFQVRRSYN